MSGECRREAAGPALGQCEARARRRTTASTCSVRSASRRRVSVTSVPLSSPCVELVVTDQPSLVGYAENLDRVPSAKGNPARSRLVRLWPDDEVGIRTEDRSKHALEKPEGPSSGLDGAAKRHRAPRRSPPSPADGTNSRTSACTIVYRGGIGSRTSFKLSARGHQNSSVPLEITQSASCVSRRKPGHARVKVAFGQIRGLVKQAEKARSARTTRARRASSHRILGWPR